MFSCCLPFFNPYVPFLQLCNLLRVRMQDQARCTHHVRYGYGPNPQEVMHGLVQYRVWNFIQISTLHQVYHVQPNNVVVVETVPSL